MSQDTSPKDSQSESSNSSPNPLSNSHLHDLCLLGSSPPLRLNRSATVKRVSAPAKNDDNTSADDLILPVNTEKFRKSIDSTYRRSLESISEYKTKNFSFSNCLYPSRDASSIESTSSDCTDYARRSSSETFRDADKTFISPSASYLSWIESVSSEYFGNTTSNDVIDVDNKVGEWNNFWLNYNSPHNRYLSSHYKSSYEDRTGDDISDCKSTCSTHREFNEKISSEHVVLTYDEVMEIMHYSQKITETLQKAIRRNDDFEHSRNDSYYSQQTNSCCEDIPREKTFSYVEPEVPKQKQMLKTPSQPGSCINALLTTGVADILKRVMNKRKEVLADEDGTTTPSRSSFTDWATSK